MSRGILLITSKTNPLFSTKLNVS